MAVKLVNPGEAPSGQHIFHAAHIADLAKRWKELTAQSRHAEAGEILEAIIKDSTSMFERLAQYEGFHNTVDLDTLVQAAREKVVRWLISWNPAKSTKADGGIFSFFSTSLTGDNRVMLADGTLRRLDVIVDGRQQVEVMSYNEATGTVEPKMVVDWSKNPAHDLNQWRDLKTAAGDCLTITDDHEVYTVEDGMVKVSDLKRKHSVILFQNGRYGPWNSSYLSIFKSDTGTSDHDWNWKYDITVADNHNFFAEGLLVANCAKHAFLSELSKVTQHQKRFHATSDTLEKHYGKEDHDAHKDDAAEDAKNKLKDITARWGDEASLGAVRLAIDATVESEREQDRQAIINTICYAYGHSPELGKFFYNWGLFALRNALYDKVSIRFTKQDILRHKETHSHVVDLLDVLGWEKFNHLIAVLGGTRIKLPTLPQLSRWHEEYLMTLDIEKEGLDPESISKVARRYKRTDKSAQEIYEEMTMIQDPDRSGEHYVYPRDEE